MIAALAAGVLLGASAGLAPGPLLTLVISHSLEHGAREGTKVALAPLLTDAPIVAVAILASGWLSGSGWAVGVLSVAGGFLVARMGVGTLRSVPHRFGTPKAEPRSLGRGALVNALSPHPYLFWMGVGVPLVADSLREGGIAAVVLFLGTFYLLLVGSKALLAIFAGRSRALLAGRAYAWTMRALGALLLLFALLLIRDGLALLGLPVP